MDTNTLLTVILTILGVLMFEGIIFAFIMLLVTSRKKKNNIDIGVFEATKNGLMYRQEIGRFVLDPKVGRKLITVKGYLIVKEKDNLGYHISENYMHFSKRGINRKYVAVMIKDGLPGAIETAVKNKTLTEQEYEIVKKIYENLKLPIPAPEIPDNVSSVVVKSDAMRLALDMYKDAQDLYNQKDANWGKLMTLASMGLFGLVIIGTIIIFIIMITKGGDFAAQFRDAPQYIYNNASMILPPG